MRRKSVQRERILAHVAGTGSHPTALEIHAALKAEMPTLSVGNAYRNLKILVEEGRLRLHRFADGVERYDAVTDAHYHFVCPSCGRVSDFDMPVQDRIVKEAQKHTKRKITGHTVQFTGLCAACAAKASKSEKIRRKRT